LAQAAVSGDGGEHWVSGDGGERDGDPFGLRRRLRPRIGRDECEAAQDLGAVGGKSKARTANSTNAANCCKLRDFGAASASTADGRDAFRDKPGSAADGSVAYAAIHSAACETGAEDSADC
jgi:hypothetical protein